MNRLSDTPNAERLHIGFFGRRNSGKSSLLNALTGQRVSLVSDVAGTTTDPVYKSIEFYLLGPCVFIDTAGFDDVGELGGMRVERTREVLEKTDLCVLVITAGQQETDRSFNTWDTCFCIRLESISRGADTRPYSNVRCSGTTLMRFTVT